MTCYWCTRRTRASVSGLHTIIFVAPFLAAQMQYKILESTFAWLYLRLSTCSTLFSVTLLVVSADPQLAYTAPPLGNTLLIIIAMCSVYTMAKPFLFLQLFMKAS